VIHAPFTYSPWSKICNLLPTLKKIIAVAS
jgi:hypothetical protein